MAPSFAGERPRKSANSEVMRAAARGSRKLSVPTATSVAPACSNASASRPLWTPPIPTTGIVTRSGDINVAKVGLTNSYLSVLLPSIISPYGIYLSRIYAAASVPEELLEAARLDGAGEFRIFATIATRLMMPAQVTVLLFQFVAIWNNYFLPLIMLNNEKLFPITVGLAVDRFLAIPGSLVSTIPLLIGCVFLQRYWQSGLTFGSVKT